MTNTTTHNKLKKIWISAIISAFIIECFLRLCPLPTFKNSTELLIDYQIKKISTIKDNSIILLGDSSLGNAVDSKMLSQYYNLPVYNLALVGYATTIGDYMLMKHILDSGKKIKCVVLFHNIRHFHRSIDKQIQKIMVNKLDKWDIEAYLNKLFLNLAIVKQSRSYKTLFFDVKTGLKVDKNRLIEAKNLEIETKQGMITYDYIPQIRHIDWNNTVAYPLNNFGVSKDTEKGFTKTINLCKKNNIPVFIALGPLWDKELNRSDKFISDLIKWINALADNNENTNLIYNYVPAAPGKWLGDNNTHLNAQGKKIFTEWFYQELSEKYKQKR